MGGILSILITMEKLWVSGQAISTQFFYLPFNKQSCQRIQVYKHHFKKMSLNIKFDASGLENI